MTARATAPAPASAPAPAVLRTLVWRNFRIDASYRFYVAARLLMPVLGVTVTLFMDRLVGAAPALAAYGGTYAPFALLGLLVAELQSAVSTTALSAVRTEQLAGTLEALLGATPAPLGRVLLGLTAYELLWSAGQAGLSAVVLVAIAAARGLGASAGATLLAAALFLAYCTGLWLLSAAGALVFKRASPAAAALSVATYVAGGVLYPLEVLPPWLQRVALALPATHFNEALRRAALAGTPARALAPTLAACAAFAAAALAAGALAFRAAVARGRRGGWLGDY